MNQIFRAVSILLLAVLPVACGPATPERAPLDGVKIGGPFSLIDQDAARAAKVVPIFVTVDPKRDTPAVLKAFVSAFHPRMVGLTGTPEAIAAAAKAYGI